MVQLFQDREPAPPVRDAARPQTQESPDAGDACFRDLVEKSIQGVLVHRSWKLLYANEAAARMLGFAGASALMAHGSFSADLFPTGSFERFEQMHRARLRGEPAPAQFETELVRRDGRSIWVEVLIRVVQWGGEPASFVTLTDITQRRAAVEALDDSERRFRNLVEGSLQAIVIADADWHIEFANAAAAELFGYAGVRAMISRQDLLQRFASGEQARLHAFGWAGLNGACTPQRWEAAASKVDGTPIWIEATMRAIEWKGRFAAQLTAVDRTRHRAADERAAEAEQHLRVVADAMPVAMLQVDSEQRLLFANRTAREWIGRPGEQLIGNRLPEVVGTSVYRVMRTMVESVLAGEPQQGELGLPRPGRSGRAVAVAMVPDRSRTGRVSGFFLAATDLTARRRAEAERLRSRRLLETTFETINQGITIWDQKLTLVAWNQRVEELRIFSRHLLRPGLTLREAYHDAVSRGVCGPDAPENLAEMRYTDVLNGRMPLFEEMTLASGVHLEVQRFYLPDGGVCSVYTDVTEQKHKARYQARLEERLAQAQKLQLISSFAGGIAHELNQPLTAICNYVRASRHVIDAADPKPPPRVTELMDKAVEQANRAAAIVQGLRRFIRSERTERCGEDINAVIEEAITLGVRDEHSNRLSIRLELAEGLRRVIVDRTQIQQVILNLLANAIQALPPDAKGIVKVTTRDWDGSSVVVAVRDNGRGIAESILGSLFLPFATTKEDGMGLGLSISRSIIELHGGRLWVEPPSGQGSEFRFTLPAEPSVEP